MTDCPTSVAFPVEDWPTVKQRWLAFWERGLYDRPILQVSAPRQRAPAPPEAVGPEAQWTSPACIIRSSELELLATFHGGEWLPRCWNPISAGWALLFGCQPHYSSATVYVDPAPAGRDGFPSLDGWEASREWLRVRESHAAFASASRGRFFVPVFWGNSNLDILGLVRGVEQLMTDFVLNPSWLAGALREMNDILYAIFEELWPLVGQSATGLEGCIETCGFWSPGKARTFDADLAYNISAPAFRRFVLPPLVDWMGWVDHASWHLDGTGNLRQLDTLLGLPELHAIQWVQGEGPHKPILPWVPLLRKIQSQGKSLQVLCEPEEVEPLLSELSPEGLAIRTYCRTESDARQLIERVAGRYR